MIAAVNIKALSMIIYTAILLLIAYFTATIVFIALLLLLTLQLLSEFKAALKLRIIVYFTLFFSIPMFFKMYDIVSVVLSTPYLFMFINNISKLPSKRVIMEFLKAKVKLGYSVYISSVIALPIVVLSIFSTQILYTLILYYSILFTLFTLANRELSKVNISLNSYTLRVFKGDENSYEVIIDNKSKTSVNVYLEKPVCGNVKAYLSEKFKVLGKGEKLRISLRIYGKLIGENVLILKIILTDSNLLAKKTLALKPKVIVIPQYKLALRAAIILLSRLTQFQKSAQLTAYTIKGFTRHTRRGEYYGVRAYTPGDEILLIHWKKSVSKQTLIVKDYRREHFGALIMLCDLTSKSFDELDSLVYTLLSTLICETLRNPMRTTYLTLYDKQKIYLNVIGENIGKVLLKIVRFMQKTPLKTLKETIEAHLDKPNLNILISSIVENIPLTMAEVSSLKNRLFENNGYVFLSKIAKMASPPANIVLIYGNVLEKHTYSLLEYNARKIGYNVVEAEKLKPKMLYEKAKKEPLIVGVGPIGRI